MRDLLGFFLFSHGWTWSFWGLAALWGPSVWTRPAVFLFILGGAGVFIGGVVMSRVMDGPPGLADLLRRLLDPSRIPLRWWIVIVLLFPALTMAGGALASLAGVSARPLDLDAAAERFTRPGQLLAFAAFILIIGPLPEEVGWRGYLLDRLQMRWNALAASIVLAAIWWSWHLPLFALPGYFEAFERTPAPLELLGGIAVSAVLYTWVYNNTNRSVLAVVILHFLENVSGELLGLADEARTYRLALMVVLVGLIVLRWGSRTLRGSA